MLVLCFGCKIFGNVTDVDVCVVLAASGVCCVCRVGMCVNIMYGLFGDVFGCVRYVVVCVDLDTFLCANVAADLMMPWSFADPLLVFVLQFSCGRPVSGSLLGNVSCPCA